MKKRRIAAPNSKISFFLRLPPATSQSSSISFLCLPRADTTPDTACTISPRPASSLFFLALLPNVKTAPHTPALHQSHPGTGPSPHRSFQSACSTVQLPNPFPRATDPILADLPHSSSPYPSAYSLLASPAHPTGSLAPATKRYLQKKVPRALQSEVCQ